MKGRYTGEKNPFYGKKHSEESKEKIRKSKKEFNKEKVWNYAGKKLILKNGVIIAEFDSTEEVAKFIGCSPRHVSHVLGGNQKTAKGYEIKHSKEYYNLLE